MRLTGTIRKAPLVRQMVDDFLYGCALFPTVTIEKHMSLRAVEWARQKADSRPSWNAIFIKAYALAAQTNPCVRQLWMASPMARLYEHPTSVAAVVIERPICGETGLMLGLIDEPELKPLSYLDGVLRGLVAAPELSVGTLRRALRYSRLPQPLRRGLLRYALRWSPKQRLVNFGTFGVSSIGRFKAEALRPLSPWTSLLHVGAVEPGGETRVRLTFDHRVMDGTGSTGALAAMEEALHGPILAELRAARHSIRLAA